MSEYICLYSWDPLPCSQQVIWLTTEQLVVILYDSCQHLFPSSQWGSSHFVFHIPCNNRKCRWALFPFWHQYRFRTTLLRRSSCTAELASHCLGLETMRVAYLSIAAQPKNRSPGCFLSPALLLSRPITNSLLSYSDIGFWQPRVFLLSLNFILSLSPLLSPPFVDFWRSLIWAQRQVGWLSRALNESRWNCSCLFDLRFSFLESRPRYRQQDVTSAPARSNGVWAARMYACTRVWTGILLEHQIVSKTDG